MDRRLEEAVSILMSAKNRGKIICDLIRYDTMYKDEWSQEQSFLSQAINHILHFKNKNPTVGSLKAEVQVRLSYMLGESKDDTKKDMP